MMMIKIIREKEQNQRVAEIGENISSDSSALQARKKMLAEKGKVRSSGSGNTKVLELLGTREILGVLMKLEA